MVMARISAAAVRTSAVVRQCQRDGERLLQPRIAARAVLLAEFPGIAPDQRGYGRTTGWNADYDADISSFRFLMLTRDMVGVLYALGHRTAEAIVGHDFGAAIASFLALARPDIFKRMVLSPMIFRGAGKPSARPQHAVGGRSMEDVLLLNQ